MQIKMNQQKKWGIDGRLYGGDVDKIVVSIDAVAAIK